MVLNHLFLSIHSFLEWTLHKFWRVSSRISHDSSWRTSSSCFRSIGSGIYSSFYSPKPTRVVQWCWNPMIVLAREDAEVHLPALQTILFGNNVWTMWCTWSPNLSKYSLAVVSSWRVLVRPTEYCIIVFLPKPSQNRPLASLLGPGISDCRLHWMFSKRKLFLI
jgi:hypothetical protein